MKIVLFRPEIPQNTGNIARTCSVTNTSLTLVRPLGFSTSSRHLKRAGLDYWDSLHLEEIDELEPLITTSCFFFSSKASNSYVNAPYTSDSVLVFGSETSGLPEEFHKRYGDRFYRIPMVQSARCLNLAVSVGVVLYEALRRTDYLFI